MLFESLGLVALAALFGSIVFFSFVMAPLMFVELGVETAGRLVRRVFPWYYVVIAVTSLIAALALMGSHPLPAGLMAAVLAGALLARQGLMPAINRARDAGQGGDAAASKRFDRLHKLSVVINGLQLLAALAALVLFTA